LVYLDDIIVNQMFQEQTKNLFRMFQEAWLELNPEKCQLFQTEVWCLEHVVTRRNDYRFKEAEGCMKTLFTAARNYWAALLKLLGSLKMLKYLYRYLWAQEFHLCNNVSSLS
jgi:hypothetical protein